MKSEFCSFCRTRQNPLYGQTADPDSYCICTECLNRYAKAAARKMLESCCFCAESTKKGFEEKDSGAAICTDCMQKYLEQTRATPPPAAAVDEAIDVEIQWPTYLDTLMDLIEVEVKLPDHTTLKANFTTPARIPWEMEKGQRNGQWSGGTYYWHPDLIFVEELTEEKIRRAVQDLAKTGLLRKAFH